MMSCINICVGVWDNFYKWKVIRFISLLISVFLFMGGSVTAGVRVPEKVAVPESLKIITDNRILGIVQYEDFYLDVRRIITRVGVAYCLEDDKDYPIGEIFDVEGKVGEDIARVLAVGYPVKTAEELGLKNDDDAYMATQIALWSIYEGYSVYDFQSDNKDILRAIRGIYERAKTVDLSKVDNLFIEYYLNDSVQKIVVKL